MGLKGGEGGGGGGGGGTRTAFVQKIRQGGLGTTSRVERGLKRDPVNRLGLCRCFQCGKAKESLRGNTWSASRWWSVETFNQSVWLPRNQSRRLIAYRSISPASCLHFNLLASCLHFNLLASCLQSSLLASCLQSSLLASCLQSNLPGFLMISLSGFLSADKYLRLLV